MIWRTSQNDNETKPDAVEKVAPTLYYIRKNYELVDTKDMEGNVIGQHWTYQERTMTESELEQWNDTKEVSEVATKSQAIVDYNIIMGNIEDPTEV